MIKFKDAVQSKSSLVNILLILERTYRTHGFVCRVTSLNDGRHMPKSKHYLDRAADAGTREITPERVPQIVEDLRAALGKDYDVVYESDEFKNGKQTRWQHIHVEWDKKDA